MNKTDEVKKAPKRCEFDCCRQKLTLTAFPCRCGKFYCSSHRFSGEHSCSYDYKEEQKKELLKYMSSPVLKPKVEIM
jgi:hypothetical protein